MKKILFLLLLLPVMGRAQEDSFLVFSDIHLDMSKDTQQVANLFYGKDAPMSLFNAALDNINAPNLKYILIPGDFNRHYKGTKDMHQMTQTYEYIKSRLQQQFPKAVIVPALGNNDYVEDYVFDKDNTFRLFYDAMLTGLDGGKGKIKETFYQGGYYAYDANEHLKIIVLNTNIFNKKCECSGEGDKELDWLEKELDNAGKKSVWLVYHIPPVTERYKSTPDKAVQMWDKHYDYEQRFYALVKAHQQIIKYQLGGHTHMDDYDVIMDNGKVASYIHTAPGLCTKNTNNPAYQMIYYNTRTCTINDVNTYYTSPDMHGAWTLEYNYRKTFGDFKFGFLTVPFDKGSVMGNEFAKFYTVGHALPVHIDNLGWSEEFVRDSKIGE